MCTLMYARCTVRYPTVNGSKLPLVDRSSSDLGARNDLTFSTVSVLSVLQEIMTEMRFWGGTSNEACGRLI